MFVYSSSTIVNLSNRSQVSQTVVKQDGIPYISMGVNFILNLLSFGLIGGSYSTNHQSGFQSGIRMFMI